MNNYGMLNLNVDCLQNVFSFLDVKDFFSLTSVNKFNSKDNNFWLKVCPNLLNPISQINIKEPGTAHVFLMQKQANIDIIKILRLFLSTVTSGTIEFNVCKIPFLTFKISNPNQESSDTVKKISVKQEFVEGLKLKTGKNEYKYPTGNNNPFFVITKEQFDRVKELSAPFKVFLENLHKKVGCECKLDQNCESFITLAKQEMRSYLKGQVSSENQSAFIKKIDNITINKFSSEDQINIFSETFPSELKSAVDRFVIFNRQIKQGRKFQLTSSTPLNKYLVLNNQIQGKTTSSSPKTNLPIKRCKTFKVIISPQK